MICDTIDCVGCGVCESVCPKQCIEMKENDEGFLYPQVDEEKCIGCGLCTKKCPQNINIKPSKSEFYMAWHKDKEVLQKSSSGGVFSALANYFLERNGVVVGAYYDSVSKDVRHIAITSADELDKLRLSKYYQSRTDEIFKDVRRYIDDGRLILFSGTACQIAALKAYLGDKSSSSLLYTVDVLCHGVANKKTVMAYIHDKEKQYKKKIIDFAFRVKADREGWQSGGGRE